MAATGRNVEAPQPTITAQLAAVRLRAVPATVVLTLMIGTSAVLRLWAGTRVVTPWINSDEITYSELGRSLFLTGHLTMLGRPIGYLSLVYPGFVGLPLTLGDVGVAYALLKGLQAVAMSLTAVPVYLWSRTLVRPRWALVAAALTLALPGLAYSGLIMSEVVFLPLAVLAAWAMAAALARPTLRNQALVAGAIALLVATRLQAIVFLPAFATAIGLKVLFDRRPRKSLREFAPSLAAFAGLGVLWIVFRVAGGQAAGLLGGYRGVLDTPVDPGAAAEFVMYHAADVLLLTSLLPVCAVVLLAAGALRQGADDNLKAYLAVTASLVAWLVLEVGTFAERYVGHLAERNLLPLAPVLFVGFVAWLDRGAYRPRYGVVLTAVAAFVLLAALPLSRFVANALPDGFMLVPFQRLQAGHPAASLDVLLPYLALPLLALLALVPRRLTWLLPAVVGLALVYTSVSVSRAVADTSTTLAPHLFGASKNWIDRAAHGPAAYLYAGEDWNPVFESIFWNRDLRAVYVMPGTSIPGHLPQIAVRPAPGGLLRSTPSERYVVANDSITLAGTRVARAPTPRLSLWRVSGAPRVSAWLAGVDVQSEFEAGGRFVVVGELRDRARLSFYRCRAGTLRATLAAGVASTVTISRGGVALRRVHLAPGVPRTVVVRARPGPGCEFTVATDGGFLQLRPLDFRRSKA